MQLHLTQMLNTPVRAPQSQAATKQAHPSWTADLQAYLASRPASDAASAAKRSSLLKALQADSCSAEAWWAFLQHEEELCPAAASPPKALCALFGWATRMVPRQGKASSEAYQLLWIGLARQQWCVSLPQPACRGKDTSQQERACRACSPEEARATFKLVKGLHIADHCAHLYAEWARLEAAAGKLDAHSRPPGVLRACLLI